jgi:hypothetical protein
MVDVLVGEGHQLQEPCQGFEPFEVVQKSALGSRSQVEEEAGVLQKVDSRREIPEATERETLHWGRAT